jgi:hypothetical protein
MCYAAGSWPCNDGARHERANHSRPKDYATMLVVSAVSGAIAQVIGHCSTIRRIRSSTCRTEYPAPELRVG